MTFEELLYPLTAREFRESYLDKRWLMVNGHANRFVSLASWDRLNSALNSLRIIPRSSRLRLVKDGSEIPEAAYIRNHPAWGGSLRTGAFERQLAEGATMILNSADEVFPETRQLVEDTERNLGRLAWVNLYSGWRSQQGFDLHWDNHDTMIIQVYGRKAWTVYAPTCEYPTKEFAASQLRPTDPPIWQGVLQPGSFLYMPRGWWHVAVPLNEPTLHLTLGTDALVGDHLLGWLGTQLPQYPVFRMNIPYDQNDTLVRTYLQDIKRVIDASLSGDCLERVREHAQARLPRFPPLDLPEAVKPLPMIEQESVLFLAEVRHLQLSVAADGLLTIKTGSSEWRCRTEFKDALSRLSNSVGCSIGEFCVASQASSTEIRLLLTAMVLEGVLIVRSASGTVRAPGERLSSCA